MSKKKKKTKKKNSINWTDIAIQTAVGVISGVISGLTVWFITK